MASSTYKIYLFTLVILGCTVLRNGATLDDQKILDDNYIKEKYNTDPAIVETTPETFGNNEKNCSTYDNCEDCTNSSCTWVLCAHSEFMCDNEPAEYCGKADCSNVTTTSPEPTTTIPSNETTPVPTTTPEPPTTTPNTTTIAPNTTTVAPNTTTVAPNTTTVAPTTTPVPTTPTTPVTTTPSIIPTTAAPHVRHFDAGSFVGGIILTLTVTAVSFAAWKFYRRRALSTSYTNF